MSWFEGQNLYDYYWMHMRKFGEVLTDMERRGIRVDAKEYLAGIEVKARKDRARHLSNFRNWAFQKIGADGLAINPSSSVQLSTLLFGGSANQKTGQLTEEVRVFSVPREDVTDEALMAYETCDTEQNTSPDGVANDQETPDELDGMKAVQLKALCKDRGLKVSGKKSELQERLRGHFLVQDSTEANKSLPKDEFESMTEDELRTVCASRSLPDGGNRDGLLRTLRDDQAYNLEIIAATADRSTDGYRTISEALENAVEKDGEGGILKEFLLDLKAKANEKPKNVKVTITSLGIEPQKFTVGGAPSVTADVLRKLAGDPFADPPNYGRVSIDY